MQPFRSTDAGSYSGGHSGGYYPQFSMGPGSWGNTQIMPVSGARGALPENEFPGQPMRSVRDYGVAVSGIAEPIPLHILSIFHEASTAVLLDEIVRNNKLVSAVNAKGETLLHMACREGREEIIRLMLVLGANAYAQDNAGLTPSHHAADRALLRILDILHKEGINVDPVISGVPRVWQLLDGAIQQGFGRLSGCSQNLPVLSQAVSQAVSKFLSGDPEKLTMYIELGVDFECSMASEIVSFFGDRMLRKAVEMNQPEIVNWLLTHLQANNLVNQQDNTGDTVLQLAGKLGHHDIFRALLPFSNASREAPETELLSLPKSRESSLANPALTGLRARHDFPENVSRKELLRQALKDDDKHAVRVILNHPSIYTDQPVRHYDSLVYLSVSDSAGRLKWVHQQFSRFPGAYLVTLEKNSSGQFSEPSELVYGKKSLTKDSKIMLFGHGPEIGKMPPEQLAAWFDSWLTAKGCKSDQTPRITLVSCNTAERELIQSGYDQYIQQGNSFVETLVRALANYHRYPEVTASMGLVITTDGGNDISGFFNEVEGRDDEMLQTLKWQGPSIWTYPGYAEQHGINNVTMTNYDENLIQVYQFDPNSRQVDHWPKHFNIDEPGGLHSIMP